MTSDHGTRVDPLRAVRRIRTDGESDSRAHLISLARSALHFSLRSPWWTTFVLCALLDAVLFLGPRRPSVEVDARVYFWGLAMSAGFFYWLGLAYRLSPRFLEKVLAFLLAAGLLLVLGVNVLIYREFGQYLTRSMLQFMGENPFYFEDYSFTYLFKPAALVAIVIFAALAYLWYPKRASWGARAFRTPSLHQAPTRFWFIHLPLAYAVSMLFLTPYANGALMPVVTATISALTMSRPPAKAELHYAPARARVVPLSTDPKAPNILIIANESWGKQQGLPFYGAPVDAMPFLTAWMRTDPEHFLVWKSAYTSSTATDVSLPSLVTGVEPDESADKLHRMPLLWQWGKASGAYTFYLTSVRQSFGRLDQFFKCNERDAAFGAENIDSPIVHEAGIDDIVTAGKIRDILAARRPGSRFVGMVFTNALHSPFQDRSRLIERMPPFDNRYDKALYILDRSIEVMVNALKEKGVLDNTVIFFTADHAETPIPAHTPHRIYSYYEEFFGIPYVMYVPKQWKASHPDLYATVRANEIQNVSNLDIMPTIVDLLGLTRANTGLVAQLKGESLVRAIQPKRMLVGLSTNDVRTWEEEGMGLVWGPYRFVCSNVEGPRFFDLVSDPAERQDRWPALDGARKRVIVRAIHSSYHLTRLCGNAR